MADVEREVILEMAAEALTATKSSPLSPTYSPSTPFKPAPKSPDFSKSSKKNDEIKNGTRNGVPEVQSFSDNKKAAMDVFEMRLKTDQVNSTDSPVKISQHKNLSPLTNEKDRKESLEGQNASVSQSKSWYDFLPFTQKRSPPQTAASDHGGKPKKSSPSSTQNNSTDKNLTQEPRPETFKQEVDKCNGSSKLVSAGTNLLNNQITSSKQVEKQKCVSDLPLDPVASFDLQQSHVRGKNYRKAEQGVLEEFTQQQHKNFHDQMKKYAKLKHRGKNCEKSRGEGQCHERAREKESKGRHHKHRDRTHASSKKSSELHQCLNCQLKGKKLPSQDQTGVDTAVASHQTSLSKKYRNQHHLRRSNETSTNNSNIVPPFSSSAALASHTDSRSSTNEGMYVTFSHCHRPLEHPTTTVETSRSNPISTASHECLEGKEVKKAESTDPKTKTGKLRLTSKGSNLPHDPNMASEASSSLLDKSLQNKMKLVSSDPSSLTLPESKLTANGTTLHSSSHLSKPSTNNLSFPYYPANGLNGLTFSKAPLCYNGINIPLQNGGKTPHASNAANGHSAIEPSIVESLKRRNGGEYNNLSLDVHFNSLHADPVQKSYVKTVPWHGENISSSKLTSLNENSLKLSSDHSSYPLYDGTENQDIWRERSILSNAATSTSISSLKTVDPPLSSVSAGILNYKTRQTLSNAALKSRLETDDGGDTVVKCLSPMDGEQNWQELLTTSHDYFNSKYRLCYDAEEQERRKSTPPRNVNEAPVQRLACNAPPSLVEGTDNNSAYVAFVSCPVISSSAQDRRMPALYTNVPTLTNHLQSLNRTSRQPDVSLSAMSSPSCAITNPHNLPSGTTVSITQTTTDTFQEGKPDILITSSVATQPDISKNSKSSKSTEPPNGGNHKDIEPATKNSTSESHTANHIISSISVAHGSKTPISPTTANQVYLPVSIANESKTSQSPSACLMSTPLSLPDRNKTTSGMRPLDSSKMMTNGFAVKTIPSSTMSVLKDLMSSSRDSSSVPCSHHTNPNGNLRGERETTPTRPTSLFVSQPQSSSPAPKSLQKVFPSTFCAPGAPPLHEQANGRTGKCLSLKGAVESDEEDATQTAREKRREDAGKSHPGHSSGTSHHFAPSSNHSATDHHFRHLSHSRQGIVGSPLHEKEKKNQPHMTKPLQNHRTDERTRCNGKNGHKHTSEPSHVFCVLPFGEYKVDNPAQCISKSFSPVVSEVKEGHQNSLHENAAFIRDHKAIQKRDVKNAVFTTESSRFSTCSAHSANEIQIFKTVDAKEACHQPNVKKSSNLLPGNRDKSESERTDKSTNALQVRYTPKAVVVRKKEKASSSASPAVAAPSSSLSSAPSCSHSNGASRVNRPMRLNHHEAIINGEMSSTSPGYVNEPVAERFSVTGPDLLQGSLAQPGSSHKTGGTSSAHQPLPTSRQTPPTHPQAPPMTSQPKKQSFLARLAHSPLSFLHRDSKNASESK